MISDLFVLIGLAFFIKIFFDGAKKLVIGANGDVVKSKTYLIHGVRCGLYDRGTTNYDSPLIYS